MVKYLNLFIKDFTLSVFANFTPTSSVGGLPFITISEFTNSAIFDTLAVNTQGVVTHSSGNVRNINQPAFTYTKQAVSWSMSDTY